MKTKICKKCGIEKNINEFRFRKDKNNFYSQCRECERIRQRKYYNLNKEYYQEYAKQHIKEQKKYRYQHKEKIKEYNKYYYNKHKDKLKEKHNNYNKQNRKKINKYNKERKKDKLIYFKDRIRIGIYKSFKRKGKIKSKKTEKILGIQIENFYNYLLQTYKDNYGYEWDGKEHVHIDHIIPLAIANTEEEIIQLCHYTNLQLLKAKDNLEKSNKINWEVKNVKQ